VTRILDQQRRLETELEASSSGRVLTALLQVKKQLAEQPLYPPKPAG